MLRNVNSIEKKPQLFNDDETDSEDSGGEMILQKAHEKLAED